MNLIKSFITIALVSIFLFTGNAIAEDKPSGTLKMETKSVAVGIGFSWGDGSLNLEGEEHKFSVKGLSVVDVGVTKISVSGEVYHLTKLEDFSGTYMAASAGLVVGGGAEGSVMKNQNGVSIRIVSTQKGIKLKLAPEGVTLTLK